MAPIIAASNQKRQNKSVNTPFMMEPLVGSFGFLATKSNAIKVSLGQFDAPEGTDPYTIDLLEACEMPDCIKQEKRISLEVTLEEIQKAWKRMKQKTASTHGTYSLAFTHY